MGKPTKTPQEKLKTKIDRIRQMDGVTVSKETVKVRNKTILSFSKNSIRYSQRRFYPSKKEDIVDIGYSVEFPLNHENLKLLGTAPINPPNGARVVWDLFSRLTELKITEVVIGANKSALDKTKLLVPLPLYKAIVKINREEGIDKTVRVNNRSLPFLNSSYSLSLEKSETSRDYGLMLEEIIASGALTQQDIIAMTNDLESGDSSNIVIEQEVSKQVSWLIDSIQKVIDTPQLTKPIAKELGKHLFNFPKTQVKGPEDLLERILTKYGKNTLFGAPVLINIDQYVTSKDGFPRTQFDILLVNFLGDIEIVELKKPDEIILDFDSSRNKFYASKPLSIAIAQSERYVSSLLADKDGDYTIQGQKLRDFLNSEVGGVMEVETCRPTAIIIIGTYQSICKPYDKLSKKDRDKFKKQHYEANAKRAFKELKSAHKNIQILTYSELLDTARARLALENEPKPDTSPLTFTSSPLKTSPK